MRYVYKTKFYSYRRKLQVFVQLNKNSSNNLRRFTGSKCRSMSKENIWSKWKKWKPTPANYKKTTICSTPNWGNKII